METQNPYQQPVFKDVTNRHSDGGLSHIITAVFCTAIGIVIGWGLVTWNASNVDKAKSAATQQVVVKAANEAWGDGVMWGALAMKNLDDMKVQTRDFGVVIGKAKELKVQFMAKGAKDGANGKVR